MAKDTVITTEELFGKKKDIFSTEEVLGEDVFSTEDIFAKPPLEKPIKERPPFFQRALERIKRLRVEREKIPAEERPILGKPEIPTEVPELAWTPPGLPAPELAIRKPYPEEIYPTRELTAREQVDIGEKARRLSEQEFFKKYPARAGLGYYVTPRERGLMFMAELALLRPIVTSTLGTIARKVPAFGSWATRHRILAPLLSRAIEGGVAGVTTKAPGVPAGKAAFRGAVTSTVWDVVHGIVPPALKALIGKARPEIPRVRVVGPPALRPPVRPPPVAPIVPRLPVAPAVPPAPPVPAVVPPVVAPPAVGRVLSTEEIGKPIVVEPTPPVPPVRPPVPKPPEPKMTVITPTGERIEVKPLVEPVPVFESTEEALAYGKRIKGDTEIIEPLKKHRKDLLAQARPMPATNEKIRILTQAQMVREAIEEAEKPIVKPEVPPVVPIRKEAVIFPKGKAPLLADIKSKLKEAPGDLAKAVELIKPERKLVRGKWVEQKYRKGAMEEFERAGVRGFLTKEPTGKELKTIRFQLDGGFDIDNTKEALWTFFKRVRATPERIPIAPPIPKVRIPVRPPRHSQLVKDFETEIVALKRQIGETVSKTKLARLNEGLAIAEENLREAKLLREKNTNDRIYDIVRTSESMLEAQKKIKKDLDLDIPMANLKSFEPQVKGGLPVDASEHIVEDLRGKVKQTEKKDVMNFGVSEVANISAEDLVDSMTFMDRAKDYTATKYKQLKEAIHSVELAQNYLYSYPDSKPVAEGMIDAQVKQLRKSNDVDEAMRTIQKATNKNKVAEILVEADRKERIDGDIDNVISKVNAGIEKGTMTQKDKDAIRAFGTLRKVVKEQIITDILESRVGVRVKSDGMRYDVTYVNRKGKVVPRKGITEITLDRLMRMHPNVTITDQNEKVTFRHLDPETGKYVTRTELVKDYDEVVKILGKETQGIVRETLPYVNWIPHNRIYGKYWVEAYEPLAAGIGETKIFSARVPNKLWADKMQAGIKEKFPSAKVEVKPHSTKMKYMPSFGSMVEVSHYLHRAGVDPKSEAGQKIINAYRSMSGLMSSLIHAQNIAGYRVDFEGVAEGMERKATSAVNRGFRQEVKDLSGYTKDIKDDFRYNVATKYINAMSSVTEGNVVLDAAKALTYFWILGNKGTYVIQNLSEPLWALARVPKLNKPLQFMTPLPKEYKALAKRATKEGIIRPFYGEQIAGRGLLYNINILGNWSESVSSRWVFNTGLRVARDKGLTGDEAYREAYQFLFNVGKPYYRNPNTIIALLGKEGTTVNKYGFIFLRWVLDWMNKTARAPVRSKLKTLLVWLLLGGAGTLPFGRKILHKLGLVDIRKNPKRLTLSEKAFLGGLPGTLGVSSRFLTPMFYKGLGEVRTGVERGFNILGGQIRRGKIGYGKYGTIGILGAAPLGGFQYPISGITKVRKGIIEVRGKKRKVIYKPESLVEKIVTGVGLTPFQLSQIYQQKREPRPKPRVFR